MLNNLRMANLALFAICREACFIVLADAWFKRDIHGAAIVICDAGRYGGVAADQSDGQYRR